MSRITMCARSFGAVRCKQLKEVARCVHSRKGRGEAVERGSLKGISSG